VHVEILFCGVGHKSLDSLFMFCGKVAWSDTETGVVQVCSESGWSEVIVG
jgi:hypothetical protein